MAMTSKAGWVFCATNPYLKPDNDELFYVGKAHNRRQINMDQISKFPFIPGKYELVHKVFVPNVDDTYRHVQELLQPFLVENNFYNCDYTPIDKTLRLIEQQNHIDGAKLDSESSVNVDSIFKGGERFRCQPTALRRTGTSKVIGFYNSQSKLIECAGISDGQIIETRNVKTFDGLVDFFSDTFPEHEILVKTGTGWKRCEVWDGQKGSGWIDLWEYPPLEKYLEGKRENIPACAYNQIPPSWPKNWNSERLSHI